MESSEWVAVVSIFTAVVFQGWVTWRVWRSSLYERGHKLAQSKLIWLLPVLGAVLVFSVLHDEERHSSGKPPELRM